MRVNAIIYSLLYTIKFITVKKLLKTLLPGNKEIKFGYRGCRHAPYRWQCARDPL